MDNHDQTKLEIAAAATEVADELSSGYVTEISVAISGAFRQFAEGIRERVSKENHRD